MRGRQQERRRQKKNRQQERRRRQRKKEQKDREADPQLVTKYLGFATTYRNARLDMEEKVRIPMTIEDLGKPMPVATTLVKKYPAPREHLTCLISVDEKLEVTAANCLTKEDDTQQMMSPGTSHHDDALRAYNMHCVFR